MKADLLTLLLTREIAHPTTIKSIVLQGGALRVAIEGYAWWRQSSGPADEGAIEFVFEGLCEGALDVTSLAQGDEALEYFSITSLKTARWAQPATHAIYCSAPVPDPLALWLALERHLKSENAFWTPDRFFNCGETLSRFVELCAAPSFLVAQAPASVADAIHAELVRQRVKFNTLTGAAREPEGWLLVRFDDTGFLCTAASAVFED
jgi:hypothetical protein